MKLVKWVISVAVAVFVVEFALAYFCAPLVNLAALGQMLLIMVLVLALLGVVVFMTVSNRRREQAMYADRDRERQAHLEMSREMGRNYREGLNVVAGISERQAIIIDRLLDQGAEVRRLRSGGYALVRLDGAYTELTDEQVKYALEGPR